MKRFIRLLTRPVTSDKLDNSFALWTCACAALAVLILGAGFFLRNSRDAPELVGGLALSLATFGILLATGISVVRLERAWQQHPLPTRARLGEFAGYAVAVGVLLAGVCWLATLPLERPGMTMGLLIVLIAAMGVMCLGAWSTLRQVSRRRP